MSSSRAEGSDVKAEVERREEDIINILVATDIHLGYAEKDPIRGQDTFVTFEEILNLAVTEKVDFILLGGDLFHDSRPTAHSLFKCTELLKKYCLGDRPVQIEFLSDPSRNFATTGNDTVNYEDPNLNVSYPVFSIHGNHDDPTGEHQISALNLLATTGLVNYFGKYTDLTNGIDIEPILLKKGETKLALFGLSHIKDERLARMFLDNKVNVLAPSDDDAWFNLLVLHQNRANRGVKAFIPDHCLPEVLDLVIWGHEHDCRITPEESASKVFISQPGSSVATSLALGESIEKHVGLLKIYKKQFNMIPIPLKTVRPFVYRDLILHEEVFEELNCDNLQADEKTLKIVEKNLEEMFDEAENRKRDIQLLPLIRLNVNYFDELQTFNAIRFGQRYSERVANPSDMIKLKYLSMATPRAKNDRNAPGGLDDMMVEDQPRRVEDLLASMFENDEELHLKSLSWKALTEAVKKTVDTGSDAVFEVSKYLVNDLIQKLESNEVDMDDIDKFIVTNKVAQDEETLVEKILSRAKPQRKRNDIPLDVSPRKDVAIDDPSSDEDSSLNKANISLNGSTAGRGGSASRRPARGPGSRGGRGSRRARGTARGSTY